MASNMSDGLETARDVLRPLYGECIALIALATMLLSVRCAARFAIKRAAIGADDILLFGAYVVVIAMCAIGLAMAKIEGGDNVFVDSTFTNSPQQIQQQLEPILKCIYAIAQLLYFGFTLPKLSLLALYLRVFSVGKRVRQGIWTMAAVASTAWLAFTLVQFFACSPVDHFWKPLQPGNCINLNSFYRSIMGINFCIDMAVLVLPIPPLWKLHAPLSRRLGLMIVFCATCIGTVISIIRFVMFLHYTAVVIKPVYTANLIPWVIAEPFAYFAACCLAASGPVIGAARKTISSKLSTPTQTDVSRKGQGVRKRYAGSPPQRDITTRSTAHGSPGIGGLGWYELRDQDAYIGVQTDASVTRSTRADSMAH